MTEEPDAAIRELTHADIPALFRVRPRTRENALTVDALRALGITPESVATSLAATTCGWVCESPAREVVGFCMADRDTGELLVIALIPEHEGRGIGGRLMQRAEAWLARSGCTRAWLTTGLDPALRAYGFYRRRGWRDWKLERGQRWMQLALSQTASTSVPRQRTRTNPMPPELVIEQVDPQGRAALSLLTEAAVEARALYPELHQHDSGWPTNGPTPDRGIYLVGFVEGAPVACGALRPIDAMAVEVRRMFVQRVSRNHGFATAILQQLEAHAGVSGFSVLRLETGNRQHPAIRLYESYGFKRVAAFGEYANDPTSVCFEKPVSPCHEA